MTTNDSLQRLGRYVIARRQQLGYLNRVDLARGLEGELTGRTLADIENGDRRSSPNTYAIVERALHWQPGTIDRILAGSEPDASSDAPPVQENADYMSIRELAEQLRGRLNPLGIQLNDAGIDTAIEIEEAGLLHPSVATRERRSQMATMGGPQAKRELRLAYARTNLPL